MIAGTGSMYPTFPKGEGTTDIIRASEIVAWPKMRRVTGGVNLFGFTLFSYKISHGDIIEFSNEKTKKISFEKYQQEAGFVKRVIALAGDKIQLRDGYVLLNGSVLNEPYIAKPRSTYGGDYLPDCKEITIPAGFVFVMGDNRKASLDSRFELGLVNEKDIHYFISWNNQEEYKKNWRDTKDDLSLAHSTTLDEQEFVKLLNKKREEDKIFALKYNLLLSNSAKIRGQAMLKYNDFSIEASKSGMTLKNSLKKSGYKNIVSAEVFTHGFYEAEELLNNFLEFPQTKNILFSTQYQEIGLSAVIADVDNCPMQVVVAHLGGYVPPNYSKEEKESWASLIKSLEDVIPSYETARSATGIDQDILEKVINLLTTRLSNAKRIYARIQKNEWLTEEEEIIAADDKRLSQETESLISKLIKR